MIRVIHYHYTPIKISLRPLNILFIPDNEQTLKELPKFELHLY